MSGLVHWRGGIFLQRSALDSLINNSFKKRYQGTESLSLSSDHAQPGPDLADSPL